jgi:hypothetical protein
MEHTLKELFKGYIQNNNKETLYLEQQIPAVWNDIAGDFIVSQTKKIFFKNGVLQISIPNAALKFELNTRRTELIKKINSELKKEIVKEIVFY